MADLESLEDVAIGVAAMAGAVVGQHPLDPDPDLGEARHGDLDGPRRALAALVGDRHDHAIAAGVVDEHLEMVVAADAAVLRGVAPTEDAPATAVGHPTELLVVLVDERARMAGHVADRGAGHPIGVAQAVEAGPAEDAVDGRAGVPGERRQAGRT